MILHFRSQVVVASLLRHQGHYAQEEVHSQTCDVLDNHYCSLAVSLNENYVVFEVDCTNGELTHKVKEPKDLMAPETLRQAFLVLVDHELVADEPGNGIDDVGKTEDLSVEMGEVD